MTDIPLADGAGKLHRYADFPSENITPRPVDVWCPPGYAHSETSRYPVLYMQDGQNLFESSNAYAGIDWGVDRAIQRLVSYNQIKGAIVVGVWNSSQRWREYMPQQALELPQAMELKETFSQANGGPPLSDQYLSFLVEELKPFIDANFRTLPGQGHTFIMGSSMGGLLSLYALEQYPELFTGAGCLSTHWPAGGDLLVDYLGEHLPDPTTHKLYFDFGTKTMDAEYEPYQQRMDTFLQAAGYQAEKNWTTRKFGGAEHSEVAWRARVHIPLLFLLG